MVALNHHEFHPKYTPVACGETHIFDHRCVWTKEGGDTGILHRRHDLLAASIAQPQHLVIGMLGVVILQDHGRVAL